MSNNLYNRLKKIDESLQNRVTLRESIEKEFRLQELNKNHFDYIGFISQEIKMDFSKITEEKQKIKRK